MAKWKDFASNLCYLHGAVVVEARKGGDEAAQWRRGGDNEPAMVWSMRAADTAGRRSCSGRCWWRFPPLQPTLSDRIRVLRWGTMAAVNLVT